MSETNLETVQSQENSNRLTKLKQSMHTIDCIDEVEKNKKFREDMEKEVKELKDEIYTYDTTDSFREESHSITMINGLLRNLELLIIRNSELENLLQRNHENLEQLQISSVEEITKIKDELSSLKRKIMQRYTLPSFESVDELDLEEYKND